MVSGARNAVMQVSNVSSGGGVLWFFDALPSIVAKEKARTVRNLDNKYDSWDRKIDEYEHRGGIQPKLKMQEISYQNVVII